MGSLMGKKALFTTLDIVYWQFGSHIVFSVGLKEEKSSYQRPWKSGVFVFNARFAAILFPGNDYEIAEGDAVEKSESCLLTLKNMIPDVSFLLIMMASFNSPNENSESRS